MKHFGLVRLSALGDVLWTYPLARALRQEYKDSKVTWIIDPSYIPLFEGVKDIDFFPLKKPHTPADYYRCFKILKNLTFDVLFCTQVSLRINLLYPMIKSPLKIGFDKIRGKDGHFLFIDKSVPYKEKEHSLAALLSLITLLGIKRPNIYPPLPISPIDKKWALGILKNVKRPWIVIHPMASSLERVWPSDRQAKLILKLSEKFKTTPILSGTQGDKQFISEIKAKAGVPIIDLGGKCDLGKLKALLSVVDLLISSDSGPIHLAAAQQTKTIGLYVAVPARYTGPYGQIENCIDKYQQAKDIFQENKKNTLWNYRIHHPQMMNLIEVDEVYKKVVSLLPL